MWSFAADQKHLRQQLHTSRFGTSQPMQICTRTDSDTYALTNKSDQATVVHMLHGLQWLRIIQSYTFACGTNDLTPQAVTAWPKVMRQQLSADASATTAAALTTPQASATPAAAARQHLQDTAQQPSRPRSDSQTHLERTFAAVLCSWTRKLICCPW
jgi:hypothetical protein